MSTHDLIARLRSYAEFQSSICSDAMCDAMCEGADLIEHQAARIAELEARDGEAEAIYQVTSDDSDWQDVDWLTYESTGECSRRVLYTHPPIGDAAGKDEVVAWRYRINGRIELSGQRLDHFWFDRHKGDYAKGDALFLGPPKEMEDALRNLVRAVQQYFGPVEGGGFFSKYLDAAIACLTQPANGDKP